MTRDDIFHFTWVIILFLISFRRKIPDSTFAPQIVDFHDFKLKQYFTHELITARNYHFIIPFLLMYEHCSRACSWVVVFRCPLQCWYLFSWKKQKIWVDYKTINKCETFSHKLSSGSQLLSRDTRSEQETAIARINISKGDLLTFALYFIRFILDRTWILFPLIYLILERVTNQLCIRKDILCVWIGTKDSVSVFSTLKMELMRNIKTIKLLWIQSTGPIWLKRSIGHSISQIYMLYMDSRIECILKNSLKKILKKMINI